MKKCLMGAALAAILAAGCDRAEHQEPEQAESEGESEEASDRAESPITPRPQMHPLGALTRRTW